MLSSDCTIQDVKNAIHDTRKFIPYDDSFHKTSVKTLNKLELLLEFMEIGGEGIKYRGGSVEIDTKYLATLSGKKWCVIGKNWWYPYGNPTDLLHKLRGSADA
jgi:hypothetical protein